MSKQNSSIIYFGGAIPVDIENEVARVDIVPHMASQKFSWSVVRALCRKFDTVYNISSCDIRNYPAGDKLVFGSRCFSRDGVQGFFVGFINLLLLKHLWRMLVLFVLVPLVTIKQRARYMLVHGSHTPFMFAAVIAKCLFRVRIAILLTDQHGKSVPSDGKAGTFLRSLDSLLMSFLVRRFDAHICLSPVFVTKFNLRNVFVVPGILSEDFKASMSANSPFKEKRREYLDIVYAGSVNVGNGIDLLIKAFRRVVDPKVRLIVYGTGELVDEVKLAARLDSRIYYGGVVRGESLTKAILSATLLINPRPVGYEYAQTSFPSKLIEYMATGVPTLTTQLLGIPDELRDCLYFFDSDSEESIAQGVINVLDIPLAARAAKGLLAAERVCSLYSEASFAQRTYELLVRSGAQDALNSVDH